MWEQSLELNSVAPALALMSLLADPAKVATRPGQLNESKVMLFIFLLGRPKTGRGILSFEPSQRFASELKPCPDVRNFLPWAPS